jgi:hypothetical protein
MGNNKNYFDTNIQRDGIDFLDLKRVQEIQKDSKRIFKDMAYGNINYEKHGIYFTDPRFLEQLIIASSIEMEKHLIKYNALSDYYIKYKDYMSDSTFNQTHNLIIIENNLYNIMSILNKQLLLVKSSNYNIAQLTCIPALLKPYKNVLKDNYNY